MQVDELYLHGRLFTWTNQRHRPTMERIDRAFATIQWFEQFADHHLRALSLDYSDHSPLLLQLSSVPWAKPRFRFEGFWVPLEGFEEVVKEAWSCSLSNVDACRVIDYKLRRTANALKSWSMRNVGSAFGSNSSWRESWSLSSTPLRSPGSCRMKRGRFIVI